MDKQLRRHPTFPVVTTLPKGRSAVWDLIAASPVPTMMVDYTRLLEHYQELRSEGVTNLFDYLSENPKEIRVLSELLGEHQANDLWDQLYGDIDGSVTIFSLVADEGDQPEIIQSIMRQFEAAWNGALQVVSEHQAPSRRGLIWVRSSWRVPVTENGPDYRSVIIADLDISDLKQAEAVLRETVESKDRFLAGVSHEIRTPLTAIYGFGLELKGDWKQLPPAQVDELLGAIVEQSSDLSALVDDLLVATRVEIGAVSIYQKPHTLDAVFRATDPADFTRFDVPLDQEVLVDLGRTRQILRNLIGNARRYGGDAIEARAFVSGSALQIEIRDNGDGVAPDVAENLFRPYAHSDAPPGLTESVGLGLYVSKTLAEMMGGTLTYLRDRGWTVFALRVPIPGSRPASG